MEDFNKKIEETLSSLEGVERAEMPSDLEQKIRQHIGNQKNKQIRIVPMRTVWFAAAVFLGIIILNMAGLFLNNNLKEGRVGVRRQINGIEAFTSTYFNDSYLNY